MITLHESAVRLVVTGEPAELDKLEEAFKVRPAGYHFAPSFDTWRATAGREGWDGWARPMRRLARRQASILRGRRDELIAKCQEFGFELDLAKLLPRPYAELLLEDVAPNLIRASFQLDDYQRRCIHRWLVQGIGVNQVAPGIGKTACFAGSASFIKQRFPKARFLYITPAERLVRQVTKSMREFLPDFEIGQYGGGKKDCEAKDMVVATVAMIHRHRQELAAAGWFRTFLALFYDEVHHCVSKTSQDTVLQISAYFRFGASASLMEADEEKHATMKGLFGNILGRLAAAPYFELGRLATPYIYVEELDEYHRRFAHLEFSAQPMTPAWCLIDGNWVRGTYLGPLHAVKPDGTPVLRERRVPQADADGNVRMVKVLEPVIETGFHRIEMGGREYHVESRWCLLERVYDRAIVSFNERNERILRWAKYFSDKKYPTLIVCTRTLHILILQTALRERIDPNLVEICLGETSSARRDEIFEWFRTTPGSVLITPLAKEGVSINEIRAGVVADYVGDIETANQILGRFMRPKPTPPNVAQIVWFQDGQHRALRTGSKRILYQFESVYVYEVNRSQPPPDFPISAEPTLLPAEPA